VQSDIPKPTEFVKVRVIISKCSFVSCQMWHLDANQIPAVSATFVRTKFHTETGDN